MEVSGESSVVEVTGGDLAATGKEELEWSVLKKLRQSIVEPAHPRNKTRSAKKGAST